MGALRVLLVDDEEELVTSLEERLSFRGIEAQAATRGRQALEILTTQSFDVIVADLKMPGLGGLDLVESIRKENLDVPVILVTGHGPDPKELSTVAALGCDILLKPFDIETLVERIRAAACGPEVEP